MITEAQEAAVVQARGKSPKFKQDKRHPFLINVKDGRLFPNVGALRDSTNAGSKDYRIFTGSPKATHDERMKWLETQGATLAARVIDSGDSEPFDIGKASVDEMVAFAATEYQVVLDPKKHHNALRAELRALAKQHGSLSD